MERRTFLTNSILGTSGLARVANAGWIGMKPRRWVTARQCQSPGQTIQLAGRSELPASASPTACRWRKSSDTSTEQGPPTSMSSRVPETCRGQKENTQEALDGPTLNAMSVLAKKHNTYILCPIDRHSGTSRLNTAVLLDRNGKVACLYNKVFPYWAEFDLHPPVDVGEDAPVYTADFGKVGLAICFDVNFPEVWKRLADQGAELVLWPSAYSAGTSLQAHAINHHYYIVSTTLTRDCLVYDITGEKMHYSRSKHVNVATVSLDLDRGLYHENFNIAGRDRLLKEHVADIEQEKWLELEQWFVLKARRPGVSARRLAKEYGLEELRHYLDRSRRSIDERRGWEFAARIRS